MVIVQFCSSALMLGGYLLFICFLTFVILSLVKMVWYGLLFFLVYIGGLLVLFLYVFSLNSNPQMKLFFFFNSYIYVLGFIFFFFLLGLDVVEEVDCFLFSNVEDNSVLLFGLNESLYVVYMGLFLVYVLFVIRYITRCRQRALRPFWY